MSRHGDSTARDRAATLGNGAACPYTARGWGVTGELGAYYQGDGRLNSVGCSANALVCQAIARDVAIEQGRFADQVSDVPTWFPVLRVGVSWRF